jgi:hypothetical protein
MEGSLKLPAALLGLGGCKLSLRLIMPDLDLKDDTSEVVVEDTEFFRGAARLLLPFARNRAETWRGEPGLSGAGILRLGEPIQCREAVERG